jgi:hypothetical protein
MLDARLSSEARTIVIRRARGSERGSKTNIVGNKTTIGRESRSRAASASHAGDGPLAEAASNDASVKRSGVPLRVPFLVLHAGLDSSDSVRLWPALDI